jgi:hypothetical protein
LEAFTEGEDSTDANERAAVIKASAGGAAAGLGVLAIIAIIVAAIIAAVIVTLIVLGGGTGLLIWKRTAMKLDSHASDFEGELVEMNSVPMGVEIEAPIDADQAGSTKMMSNPMAAA